MQQSLETAEDWTGVGLLRAMHFLQARLRVDLSVPGMPAIEVGRDSSFGEVLPAGAPGRSTADIVVIAGGHRFSANLGRGVEAACAHAASVLQDDVMDLLQRPWPELTLGAVRGVLEPGLDPFGIAHWSLRGRPVCAVGHLRPLWDRLERPWP